MYDDLVPHIPLEFRCSKAVTLGVFDGVHKGHCEILKKLHQIDPNHGLVITFKTHPDEFLFGRDVNWICSHQQRLDYLKEAGAAHVIEWPFDKSLVEKSATDFVQQYFLQELNCPHVVMGYDLRFGKNAQGNYQFLKNNYSNDLKLSLIEPFEFEREVVSSTRIREMILSGDMKRTQHMLGRPFSTRGTVVKGFSRGKKLGFPTANIKPHKDIILPPHGVYAVAMIYKGKRHQSVANLGLRPTFVNDDSPLLEVHVLDYDDNLYDQQIDIEWQRFIRPEKRFSDQEELITQINKDIKEVRDGTS